MNILTRARGLVDRAVAGARSYRFEGEQENHADLLRERRVSLSMMASADPENPDQQRMASEIEHDAEARLTVLVGKPRLTLEEKRERDAIQKALADRRQGFAETPTLVARAPSWLPARFAALPAASLLASPVTWVVAGFALVGGWGAWNGAQASRFKAERNEARAEMDAMQRDLAEAQAIAEASQRAAAQADQLSRQTAANIEAERARRLRAEREARRIRDAMEQARAGNAVDYGFGGVRNPGASDGPPGASSDNPAGGNPG